MTSTTTTKDGDSSAFDWIQTLELGYVNDGESSSENSDTVVCFHCGKSDTKLSKCSKCQIAAYCSRDCQVKDWKAGSSGGTSHKLSCAAYSRVGPEMKIPDAQHQAIARQEIVTRVRFYACPYAVHRYQILGKGFLFVQGTCTLAEMSFPRAFPHKNPKNGLPLTPKIRSLLIHYLTLGEYDSEVCRDDFELALVRSPLQEAVEQTYDPNTQVVILTRFRCGHVALGIARLVPDYGICKSLGKDYYADNDTAGALQLNMDDV